MDSAETREEYVCSNKLLLRMESWEEQCAEVINNKKQCKLNGKEPRDAVELKSMFQCGCQLAAREARRCHPGRTDPKGFSR
jgi:hypothetical protein